MGYDVRYDASNVPGPGPDNIMGSDNNYETVTGSVSKVGRCIASEAKRIDGEWIGNRGYAALSRALDTPANRQLFVYYTEQSIKWLVDNGKIKDVEVTHGDGVRGAAAFLVSFTDVETGDTGSLGLIAPWGHV